MGSYLISLHRKQPQTNNRSISLQRKKLYLDKIKLFVEFQLLDFLLKNRRMCPEYTNAPNVKGGGGSITMESYNT
jgi:hypothetical protein